MKRRSFLTAAGAVGLVGAVSGTTVVSSTYAGIRTNALLEDFGPSARIALDKFMADILRNVEDHGLDKQLVQGIALPVHIISKNSSDDIIEYKNQYGQTITLSVVDGVETFSFTGESN